MTWVLDTSAVICWLEDEPGAERMNEVLAADEPALLHAVNLVEVQYYFLRRGEQALRTAIERIQRTRITVVRDLGDALLATATSLKAFHT